MYICCVYNCVCILRDAGVSTSVNLCVFVCVYVCLLCEVHMFSCGSVYICVCIEMYISVKNIYVCVSTYGHVYT